jgi:hypothetical protein
MATETWSHEEVLIVIWAKHFPSRNLLPFDGGVCLFCDECMPKFGADCENGRTNVHIFKLVGSALRTDVNAAQAEVLILENRRVTVRDLFLSLDVYATLTMRNRGAVEVMNAVVKWNE